MKRGLLKLVLVLGGAGLAALAISGQAAEASRRPGRFPASRPVASGCNQGSFLQPGKLYRYLRTKKGGGIGSKKSWVKFSVREICGNWVKMRLIKKGHVPMWYNLNQFAVIAEAPLNKPVSGKKPRGKKGKRRRRR